MRTKEEILDNLIFLPINEWWNNAMLSSMQEYADEQSIAFAEWKEVYLNSFANSDELRIKLSYTTAELLQIFKNENK